MNRKGVIIEDRFSAKMLMVMVLLFLSSGLSAQQSDTSKSINNVLQGHVFDNYDSLVGVSVSIQGAQIGVLTDEEGNYRIPVPEYLMQKDEITLVFKYTDRENQYITYKTQKIPLSQDVYLKGDSKVLIDKTVRYTDHIYDKPKKQRGRK